MIKLTARKSLELAVEAEKAGARFYERLSRRYAHRPELAEVFLTLAADELEHEAKYREILEETPDTEPIVAHQYGRSEYLRAIAISEFYRGDDLKHIEGLTSISDVLQVAISLEQSNIAYYQGLRDEIGAHDALQQLIEEEKQHVVRLVQLLEGEEGNNVLLRKAVGI
ncbi:MAG: ferritin family protein [bacterium]